MSDMIVGKDTKNFYCTAQFVTLVHDTTPKEFLITNVYSLQASVSILNEPGDADAADG